MWLWPRPLLGLKKEGEDMINWMTTEQAAEEAMKGKIPAIECSWEHHHQGETADWVELAEVMKPGNKFNVGRDFCACCYKYNDDTCKTTGCPLLLNRECCGGKWEVAKDAIYACRDNDYSNASMKAFQEAEAELCRFIADVLEKEKAKERKTEKKKCEPKHADYGIYHGCGLIHLDGNTYWLGTYFKGGKSMCEPCDFVDDITGNLKDDLKRNSEDLREFEVNSSIYHNKFSCGFSSEPEHPIWLTIKEGGTHHVMHVTLTGITEIHQKLGRIVAFAKRQENKK